MKKKERQNKIYNFVELLLRKGEKSNCNRFLLKEGRDLELLIVNGRAFQQSIAR